MAAQELLRRTATAIYRADSAIKRSCDFETLPRADQLRYQQMAAAALSVALREPVNELEALSG